jgi:hypothetical protein
MHLAPANAPEPPMKMPCLVPLLAAAAIAAALPARADALHGPSGHGPPADPFPSLSSQPRPDRGTLFRDAYVADPSRLTGARAERQPMLLREGVGRVRFMPHMALGAGAAL